MTLTPVEREKADKLAADWASQSGPLESTTLVGKRVLELLDRVSPLEKVAEIADLWRSKSDDLGFRAACEEIAILARGQID